MSHNLNELQGLSTHMDSISKLCLEGNIEGAKHYLLQDLGFSFPLAIEAAEYGVHDRTENLGEQTVDVVGESLFHILFKTGQYELFTIILKKLSEFHPRQEVLTAILSVKNLSGWNVQSFVGEVPEPLRSEIQAANIVPTPHVLPRIEPQYRPMFAGSKEEYPDLFLAVIEQDAALVKQLLARGVPIDCAVRMEDGSVPDRRLPKLLESWVLGKDKRVPDKTILDLLLRHGLDINETSQLGISVVKQALRTRATGTHAFVKLLLERGARVDREDLELIRKAKEANWFPADFTIDPKQIIGTYGPWPPLRGHQYTREYYLAKGQMVPASYVRPRGNELPAKALVAQLPELDNDLLISTRLFSDLPKEFYDMFLRVQMSGQPFQLPKIKENKNKTVLSCIEKHPEFSKKTGALHISNWEMLGWKSEEAYGKWLNTSMLFAFSHCMHYCSAPRVFDVDVERNEEDTDRFHFQQVMKTAKTKTKKTNILSVTGFEYRNYKGDVVKTVPNVRVHSKITMKQILEAALATMTTDIVLIPYGMGVFIPQGEAGNPIKNATILGMIDALKDYNGPTVTVHCCGGAEFFNSLQSSGNPKIQFVNQSGYDAYTIANDIQDRGDAGEQAPCGTRRKSMLINAADNDWTALLDPTKTPGQFSDGHTLYHGTSDEYYALMTCFSYFSIQRMMKFFGYNFQHSITQLTDKPVENDMVPVVLAETAKEHSSSSPFVREEETFVPEDFLSPKKSCLSQEQIVAIDKVITQLRKEIKSRWPYPYKTRKQHKVNGLEAVKTYANDSNDLAAIIQRVETEYPDIRLGSHSGIKTNRTDELLTRLLNEYNASSEIDPDSMNLIK